MNILVIEDNEADQRALKEAFSIQDKKVILHMVDNGQKALQFVSRQGDYADASKPDVILLDLNLPGIRGHEVLKKLKSAAETKRIPIVILSSSTSLNDICECYDLGASSYLNKPMRFSELSNLVKSFCDFWVKEVRYCNI